MFTRGGWAVAGLSLLSAAGALLLGRWVFPLGSINHDEQTYVFSARLLGHGHLTLPESFAPFRPWASGVRAGKVVLKYTPVWPGVLALGDKLASPRLGAAAAAGAAVALMGLLGRDVFGRWREGLLAALFLALSPLFFLQTGTYLPYVLQLALNLAVVYLVLGAFRRWPPGVALPRGVALRLVAAGTLFGIACCARPYDALLLAAPIVVAAAVSMRRTPRRLGVAVAATSLGAVVPLAALAVFNDRVMGTPFENTFTITGPNDKLGFGMRGVFESSSFDFTPAHGVASVQESVLRFPAWTFGGALLVALALVGLCCIRRRGFDVWAIAGLAVTFTVGYAFFWSPYSIVRLWPGAHTMGPFYHLTLLIPLAILGAAGVGVIFDRSRALGAVTLAALFAFTGVTARAQIDRNRDVTRKYRATEHLVDDAHLGRSVLFMEDRGTSGFASSAPFLENTPALDQQTIYALDGGPDNFAVLDRFPDRTPAMMRAEMRPGDELFRPTPIIERLHVEHGPVVRLRFHITNTVGSPTVVSTLQTGTTNRAVVLDTSSTRGRTYDVTWTLDADTIQLPDRNRVPLGDGRGTVAIEADFRTPGRATERRQRLYPYVSAHGIVRVLTPGRGRSLLHIEAPTWLNQDVDPTLSELP